MIFGLFLDRDGTIIEHVPYLSDPEQVRLLPGAKEALHKALNMGYRLYLFTNQSGIGRGYYSMEQAEACNTRMIELLDLPKPGFYSICIAPETPEEPHVYRKPSPKFIQESIEEHILDPQNSYMVGDSIKDVEAGIRAGIQSVFVHNPTLPEEEALPEKYQGKIPEYNDLTAFVATLPRAPGH